MTARPVVGPQAGATAAHTYTAAGTYTVTVTVADTGGLSSKATKQVTVSGTGPPNLVGNPGFEAGTSGWNTSGSGTGVTLTRVAGGHSGGWSAQLTNPTIANSGLTLNDSPNWVATTGAGTYTASLWVRADNLGATLTLRLREYVGSTRAGAASAALVLTTRVAAGDRELRAPVARLLDPRSQRVRGHRGEPAWGLVLRGRRLVTLG